MSTTPARTESQSNATGNTMLEVDDLHVHFPFKRGPIYRRESLIVKAVDGISFKIQESETFSIVGESGCGKTTTAKMLLVLDRPTSGAILFQGQEVQNAKTSALKEYRRSVQAVFQDPWSSLNPRMRVKHLIAEPMVINLKLSRHEMQERVIDLLSAVGLDRYHSNLYPHEFSGGQRQRIGVARALALNPKLIVLDEPVSALDVSIRAQIMNLLEDLQAQYNLSFLLIAHHLATVRYMCDKVGVMYLGRIVEEAETEELFENPLHPYTRALMSAALPSHPDIQREEIILTGEVPSPIDPPSGCHFHPRCPSRFEPCDSAEPEMMDHNPGHKVVCHLYDNAHNPRTPL